jgi:hypothetical protein
MLPSIAGMTSKHWQSQLFIEIKFHECLAQLACLEPWSSWSQPPKYL